MAKNVAEEIRIRCQHTKLWYDRTAKALPQLVVGQGVRMQPWTMEKSNSYQGGERALIFDTD